MALTLLCVKRDSDKLSTGQDIDYQNLSSSGMVGEWTAGRPSIDKVVRE
jgi:hypothetical protein